MGSVWRPPLTHTPLPAPNRPLSDTGTLIVYNVTALGSGEVYIEQAGSRLAFNMALDQTFAGGIRGDGYVTKDGQGILTLSVVSQFLGGLDITGGGIRVFDFDGLGSGPVTTAADTRVIVDYSDTSNPLLRTTALMTGAGTFVKAGDGDIVLDVASAYTGGTIIERGRLGLNDGGALGAGVVQVLDLGILGIGNITLANDIQGTGRIWKTASGIGGLTGNNSGFSGDIRIFDGILAVGSTSNLGTGEIDILSGAGLTINNAANETLVNILQGVGDFRKDGAGVLSLTGTSAFTGGIFVDGGTLRVAHNAVINFANAITLNGAGTSLELNRTAGATNFGVSIGGTGQVVKTGAGTFILTGANTYSGGTSIQEGALRVTDLSALGTGPINVSQGAFLDFSVAGTASWNGAISGAGALRKSGAGDLTLVSNTLTGGLDVAQGRVIVSDPNATGGPVTTAAGSGLVFNMAAGPNVLSTVAISGGGQLIKEGAGALIIGNTNTYTGGTIINQGRVGLNVGDGLGTGTVTVNANSSLGLGNVTFNNTVTGAGSIVKTASGLAIVNGASNFTGGTVIQDGAIRITQGSGLGTGQVSLATGTSLTLDHANAATTANAITGAGQLIKTGAGVTTLTGASTFSGGTTVQAGRLHLASGAAAGTGGISVGSGAQLSFESGTLANAVTGAGLVAKLGSGAATLSGANTHSGGVLVTAGTLNAGASALGSGAVQIDSGATLAFTNAANATFGNALGGAGTLRILGTDRLTFGSNFALGAVQIDTARMRLNSIGQANFTVGVNGALDGTGRIIGNLTNNGLVAPGNSIGTLTVQGNYIHGANSILEIEFDANNGIDLLNVTGSATLNGGTLRFVSIGAAEGSGGTFLQAAGGVTGTFGTIETVGAVLPLSVIYQANSAIMAPSILTARPSTFNSQFLAAGDTSFAFIDRTANAANAAPETGSQAWAEAFASSGERDAAGASLGYEHDSAGVAGGYSRALSPQLAVGVSLGLSSSEIALSSDGGEGEQDGVLGSVYGRYEGADVSLIGGVVAGTVDQSATRNVRFNGFAASVEGETQSSVWGAFAGVNVPIGALGEWSFAASARASYLNQTQDAYSESGTSPLRLQVAEVSADSFEGQAGIAAERTFGEGGRSLARFAAGLRYQDAESADVAVTFAGSNAGVTLVTEARDTVHGYIDGELGWQVSEAVAVRAGYHGQLGEGERHEARVRVSYGF